MRLITSVAIGSLIFGIALSARADEALSLERQGDAALAADQLDDAARSFEAARAVAAPAQTPGLLEKLARTYEALGRYPQALDRLADRAALTGEDHTERLDALQKRVAVVIVNSAACDADVRVRGALVGKTCGTAVKVNAGRALVEVEKPGYVTFRAMLDLPGATTTSIAAALKANDEAILVVRSPIAGARVTVDGEEAGTVPTELVVRPGDHAVVVSQEGYETRRVHALIGVGQRSDVDLHLEEKKSITDRWWLWTAVGLGLAAAATTTTVLLVGGGDADPRGEGTIAPGRVSAPLRF